MILSQMYAVKENEFIPTELGRETITWNVGIESTVQDAGKGVLTNGAGRMATSLVMTDVEGKATANGTELKVAMLQKEVRLISLSVTDVEGKATANGTELKVAILRKGVRPMKLTVTDVEGKATANGAELKLDLRPYKAQPPPEFIVKAGCLQLSAKESADSFLEDLGIGDKRKQESLEDLEDDYALGQADSHKKQKVDEWDFEDGEISDGDDDAIRDGEMYDEFDVEFV
eukprot:gene16409-19480_t